MQHFISQRSHKNLLEETFFAFQYKLLRQILILASCVSFTIAIFAQLDWLPMNSNYTGILYFHTILMFLVYKISLKYQQYYALYVQILLLISMFVLLIMTVVIGYDEFRLGWFFLLSLSAFILVGKKYGMWLTLIGITLVSILFMLFNLHLSMYAFSTFIASYFSFSVFAYYFLEKVELDAKAFESMVRQEVDKRQAQEQVLLRQYRMQNMGEMIDAIAHQWRQPLANGSMILNNMEEELDNQAYLTEKIEELQILNAHMSKTIDDFRHLLHDSKQKSIFESHTMIEEVLMLMKNQLSSVEVEYINRTSHKIRGYKNELIQVLVTLLSNAVEVLEQRQITQKKIVLIVEEEQDTLLIHIEDNAGGIDPTIQETLFEPYISTKKHTTGKGLGLYIAKIIIEDNMQGVLSVNQGLKGARFTVKIKREL